MTDLNKPRSFTDAQWLANLHNIQEHDGAYEAEAVQLPPKKPGDAEVYIIECFICNPPKPARKEEDGQQDPSMEPTI